MNKETFNPQDRILNHLRRSGAPFTIHLTNGYQLNDVQMQAFDNFVLVILTNEKKQMMLYKHAVSSITMCKPVMLGREQEENKNEA
ncbi:RNA chaperone Hfq [Eubacteriales bacterium OttesenSCG-928-K08]|nr:RNA chaperone Hfq [Eubacteriales bacterium OttesenSCG-928-K08]